jgi:protocatechuate 3,4-dioxygenase beta subunit
MNHRIDRRGLLQTLGALAACAPLARYAIGCGASPSSGNAASPEAGAATDAGAWATGGTASMSGKASYPNPFASGAPTTCPATGALTGGPCYDSAAAVIQDISYGQNGLPLRMYLQILDLSCKPTAGATVSVWHVAPTGKYSGNDAPNEQVAFCTGNDADYTSHLYFRGVQTTDATGVVYFDTCFPGWYPSRTVHVHFTITLGSKTFTSQYVFDDALDDSIIATQPVYGARGSRDTTNLTDSVVSASTYQSFLFQTAQMSDGAMLAWQSIVLS